MRDFKKFKRIDNMKSHNDGNRTLFESIAFPEVETTLKDWISLNIEKYVLIGDVALSFYIKPRTTQDIDVLFLMNEDIPQNLNGFKKSRAHAFLHTQTHVEVEVLTPDFLNISFELAEKIIETSIINDNIKIASPSGLVASKLNRFSLQDKADIEQLLLTQNINMSQFPLTENQLKNYKEMINYIKK